MNAISMLRAQLEGSIALIVKVTNETSDEEWAAQACADVNPAGFTLWHCARSVDWGVNCAIQGIPEVADNRRWKGRLASNAWFGYDVTLATAREVAATVLRADVVEYAGEVQQSVTSWLDTVSEKELDAIPDLDRNYRASGTYVGVPQLDAWIKEDADTPVWRLLAGPCVGHVRVHIGEVEALRQILKSRNTT